jgi:ribosomal protein S18 acetylase RimI-like enzyme
LTAKKTDTILREFRIEDYDNVTLLWDEAGLPYRPQGRDSRKRIEKELKFGRSIFLVAETEGRVVGSIIGTHDGRKGWLNRLAVAKEYRRTGLGNRLVKEAERRLNALGLDVIACLIEADNKISMKVFTRLGYEKWDSFYFSKRGSNLA